MAIVNISLNNFQSEVSQSEKPVLLDFYADWCGPCQMLHPELESFEANTDLVKVGQINVDENGELAQLYGILSIPTLVLVKNGQEVARRVGGCEAADIEAFVKSHC